MTGFRQVGLSELFQLWLFILPLRCWESVHGLLCITHQPTEFVIRLTKGKGYSREKANYRVDLEFKWNIAPGFIQWMALQSTQILEPSVFAVRNFFIRCALFINLLNNTSIWSVRCGENKKIATRKAPCVMRFRYAFSSNFSHWYPI